MDLRPVTDPLRGYLYVAGGWACVGLALVGAVLPLVPTTPFLLLASWCFYRGSPRIHAWLHRSRLFGPTLDDWHHYRALRGGVKRRAIAMVVAVVAASLLLNALPSWPWACSRSGTCPRSPTTRPGRPAPSAGERRHAATSPRGSGSHAVRIAPTSA